MKSLLPTNSHADSRRELLEWVTDSSIRACKVVRALEDCVVGNHYHRLKHEIFCLIEGAGSVTIDGNTEFLVVGESLLIRRGVMHSFRLAKGSILLGAATEPFDSTDDYHQ